MDCLLFARSTRPSQRCVALNAHRNMLLFRPTPPRLAAAPSPVGARATLDRAGNVDTLRSGVATTVVAVLALVHVDARLPVPHVVAARVKIRKAHLNPFSVQCNFFFFYTRVETVTPFKPWWGSEGSKTKRSSSSCTTPAVYPVGQAPHVRPTPGGGTSVHRTPS